MLGVALALAAGGVAVAVCARARFRQLRLSPGDVPEIERALRSLDEAKSEAALRDVFPDAADAMLKAHDAGDEPARAAAASALDEILADLDRELSAYQGVAPGATRVALLSAGFGAVVEISGDFTRGPAALCAGAAGVGAAALCFELGRNMTERATELRAEWDRVASSAAARFGLADALASPLRAHRGARPRQRPRDKDADQRRSGRRGS